MTKLSATLPVRDLKALIARVAPITKKRATVPILTQCLLTAADGALSATATDLDIAVTTGIQVPGARDGDALVNPHRLRSILQSLPAGDEVTLSVDVEHDREAVSLRTPYGTFRLYGISPADEFPLNAPTRQPKKAPICCTVSSSFRDALARVSPFISTEETRYYLNGIWLHAHDGKPRVAATDGHRLGVVTLGHDAFPAAAKIAATSNGAIIPRVAVQTVLRLWKSEADARLSIWPDKGTMEIVVDGATIRSKLIDGTYPDISRVIPIGGAAHLTVNRHRLMSALRMILMVIGEKSDRPVAIGVRSGVVALDARSPDTGDIVAAVPVTELAGELPDFAINARYLREMARTVGDETVTMAVVDCATPVTFTGDDTAFLGIGMPMHGNRDIRDPETLSETTALQAAE